MSDIDAIVSRLDSLIRQEVPDVTSVPKYGGTLYTLHPDEKEEQFCGVFPYTEHAQLSFTNGATLDDPGDLLDGAGKFRRHINFAHAEHVVDSDLRGLIRQAAGM